MPLKVAIPTKNVFENNKNGILGGLLNSILNKSVKVQFKGNLNYVVLGFKKEFILNDKIPPARTTIVKSKGQQAINNKKIKYDRILVMSK